MVAAPLTSAVCITGAHRSGTSMLAQLLHACGVYLGPESELMQPSHDNPEGFWEHVGFVDLNDQILQRLGGSWDLPPQVNFSHGDAEFHCFEQNAHVLIQSMSGNPPWGWKDPRNCLTLPFWRNLIPDLRVVAIVRHPLEVAASLHARNGISHTLGFHLWRTYNAPLLTSPADETVLVTHYNSFFDDAEAEVARVLDHLRIPLTNRTPRLDAIVSTLHRHHSVTRKQVAEATIPEPVLELYYALMARSSHRREEEFKPTRKRKLGPPRLPDAEAIGTSNVVAILRAEAERRTAWAQESAEEIERLGAIIAELQAELNDRTAWAHQQDAELKRLSAIIEDLQQQVAERTQWAQNADRQYAEGVAAFLQLQKAYDEGIAGAQRSREQQQPAN